MVRQREDVKRYGMGSRERMAATNATKAARRRQCDAQRDVGQVAQAEHDNGGRVDAIGLFK